jgi:ferritin-like metal-binding protein YciE
MKITSLEDLLIDSLRDLYSAETQLVKALPKMAKAASAEELREAFAEHLEQTRGHVERLERAIDLLGAKARGKKCAAMEGLIEEGKELMDEGVEAEAVLDAGLIGAAQKVEHYEIASYGTARTWAQRLGHEEVADLLRQTLDEEKETDERLNQIAEGMVNEQAAEEGEGEEETARGARNGNGRRGAAKGRAAGRGRK